ncbi:MAG: sulfur carrier protein ThiS [Chlorobiales bacterium]|nr:sulfur carrier protein ThiS [Chlorobiales bacterium]
MPTIRIQLNGEPYTVSAECTVTDLLKGLGSDGNSKAVIINEQFVRFENRSSHMLQEGDQVEILVFAAGG